MAERGGGFLSGLFGRKYNIPPELKETSGGPPPDSASIVSSEVSEDPEKRKSLWSLLADKLGMDITRVSLPLWLFEPLTILEKAAEVMEYAILLNKANECEDPLEALAYVAAFSMSGYVSVDRIAKPFNPLLGETYEYVIQDSGFRFLAEQVSHHPPIMAAIMDNEHCLLQQDSLCKTRFMGNFWCEKHWGGSNMPSELYTIGSTRLNLKKPNFDISYNTPINCIHNLIIGFMWVDVYGTATVTNHTTGDYIELKYNKSGWFGSGRFVVTGVVKDKDGKPTGYRMEGMRNSHVDLIKPDDERVRLWTRKPNDASGKFKFSSYVRSLNAIDAEMEATLPCTDARIRPDRLALQNEQTGLAVQEKRRLEELQREDRRVRGKRAWIPRYYKTGWNEHFGIQQWDYCGDYWEEKEKRLKQYQNGDRVEEIKGCVDNLAVDYRRPPDS